MRVGQGIDSHRFGGDGPLVLGGVVVDPNRGVEATSDGDVLVHAVIDALLGAAALGDLGTHYPSSDERWHGARSLDLLTDAVSKLSAAGWVPSNVDATVIAQTVRISPHREAMRTGLAESLGIDAAAVSVKATTTDHLGFTGRDEGLAVVATVSIVPA